MTSPVGKVFISHASTDKPFVDRLVQDLTSRGVPVWYDKLDLKVGDSIPGAINEGLTAAKYFLLVLSKASVGSRWVQEEMNAALMHQVASGGTFIVPVMLEDCDVPPLLKHRRHADFRTDYGAGLTDLLAVWGMDAQAAQALNSTALYPWPDLDASDQDFVYLHSTRFAKFFRVGCDLSSPAEKLLDDIIKALDLPWTNDMPQFGFRWSFSYGLAFKDESMALSQKLRDAGVKSGDVVELSVQGTYQDLWTNELENMWDGSKMYNMLFAKQREAELQQQIRDRGPLTRDRLRAIANSAFDHI
jgi:hypothetical protein